MKSSGKASLAAPPGPFAPGSNFLLNSSISSSAFLARPSKSPPPLPTIGIKVRKVLKISLKIF